MMNPSVPNANSNSILNKIVNSKYSSSVTSKWCAANDVKGEYVLDLLWNDVLLGRGTGPNEHPGNIRFHDIVNERKVEYLTTTRRNTKALIAKEIVGRIYQQGGRFLKKLDPAEATKVLPALLAVNGLKNETHANGEEPRSVYHIQSYGTVMEKAKQALRRTSSGTEPTNRTDSRPLKRITTPIQSPKAPPNTMFDSLPSRSLKNGQAPAIVNPEHSPKVSHNTILIDSLPPDIFHNNHAIRRTSNCWSVCTPTSIHLRQLEGMAQNSACTSAASSRRNSILLSSSAADSRRNSILPSSSNATSHASYSQLQQEQELVTKGNNYNGNANEDTRHHVELLFQLKSRCKNLQEEVEYLQEQLELQIREKRIQKLHKQLICKFVSEGSVSSMDHQPLNTISGSALHHHHQQQQRLHQLQDLQLKQQQGQRLEQLQDLQLKQRQEQQMKQIQELQLKQRQLKQRQQQQQV